MKFEVYTNKSTYEWDDSCLIGELHILVDASPFPSSRWTDSISEVLIMWAESFLNLLNSGLNGEEEFFFLDGPFSFLVRTNGASMAHLRLLDSEKQVNETVYEISFYGILYAVFTLISNVVSDTRLKDVQQVKRLKNMMARIKNSAENMGYLMD